MLGPEEYEKNQLKIKNLKTTKQSFIPSDKTFLYELSRFIEEESM
jgi:hypothetical protein